MLEPICPVALGEARAWAAAHGESDERALKRYTDFAVLEVLASRPELFERLVLRGSGALWLFYGGPRPCRDLDFFDLGLPIEADDDELQDVVARIDRELRTGLPRYFPDYDAWHDRLRDAIRVELIPAPNELSWRMAALRPHSGPFLRVVEVEHIYAEKLLAILKQQRMHKMRGHDVVDIAGTGASIRGQLDPAKLASCFLQCVDRNHDNLAAALREPQVCRALAERGYPEAAQAAGLDLCFEAAWQHVVELFKMLERSL